MAQCHHIPAPRGLHESRPTEADILIGIEVARERITIKRELRRRSIQHHPEDSTEALAGLLRLARMIDGGQS